MLTPTFRPSFPHFWHDPDACDEEVKRLRSADFEDQQLQEAILRALEGGLCPLHKISASHCDLCVSRHSEHFPRGLVTQLRKVLKRREDRWRMPLSGVVEAPLTRT